MLAARNTTFSHGTFPNQTSLILPVPERREKIKLTFFSYFFKVSQKVFWRPWEFHKTFLRHNKEYENKNKFFFIFIGPASARSYKIYVIGNIGVASTRSYKFGVVGNDWLVGWLFGNSVFSETALRIFLIFCMKLGDYKGRKVIEVEKDSWLEDISEKISKLA